MGERKAFLLYHDWEEQLDMLTEKELAAVVMAAMRYSKRGILQQLERTEQLAFLPIKQQIERDSEKYERRSAANKENGKKGGRPKKVSVAAAEQVASGREEAQGEIVSEPMKDPPKKKTPPKTKYAEFVQMKEEEHQKLVLEYGDAAVKEFIRILDGYKGATGKTYKDDYRAILNWVVSRVKNENPSIIQSGAASTLEEIFAEWGKKSADKTSPQNDPSSPVCNPYAEWIV